MRSSLLSACCVCFKPQSTLASVPFGGLRTNHASRHLWLSLERGPQRLLMVSVPFGLSATARSDAGLSAILRHDVGLSARLGLSAILLASVPLGLSVNTCRRRPQCRLVSAPFFWSQRHFGFSSTLASVLGVLRVMAPHRQPTVQSAVDARHESSSLPVG